VGDAVVQAARIAACLVALLASSCVQLEWERNQTHAHVDTAAIARLEPGASDVGACLAELGAPLYVWEYAGDGVALAFGAQSGRYLDLNISIPLERGSAPVDFGERYANTDGWVLFFDADWKLVRVQAGRLRNLARELERRPAPVEDE
jgi:hypothetical protein